MMVSISDLFIGFLLNIMMMEVRIEILCKDN